MIVFSDSLVLAAASDSTIDLKAPCIGYRSEVTEDTVTATDEADGYPATNLANVSTASFWKAADGTGTKYITITPTVAADLDYIAVARHNFGSAQIAVTVETKETSGSSWVETVAEFMPTNDNALILRFTQDTFYAIRLKLAEGDAAPQAAVVYTGLLLVMERRLYVGHAPVTMSRQTNMATGVSEGGHFLGRVVTGSKLATAASFQNLTPAWVRSDLDPFIDAARTAPFFWAWRPQTYPNETAFGWLMNDARPVNARSNGMMSVEFEVQGAAS